jgi:hypothetical protein
LLAEAESEPDLLDPDTTGLLNKELSDNALLHKSRSQATSESSDTGAEDSAKASTAEAEADDVDDVNDAAEEISASYR